MNRRFFLKAAGLATATLLFNPARAFSAARTSRRITRELHLYHYHTCETLRVPYFENGKYLGDGMKQINHFLRDHRSGDEKPIDRELLNLLHTISTRIGTREPLHVISGYRSPSTNAQLRQKSKGVAKNSFHIHGKAVDITIPDVPLGTLRRVALSLNYGGVGYYPRSNFVHLDTGPVRSW